MFASSVIYAEAQPCKCDLASEILQRFGQLRLQVTGASMLPSVWPGDVVTIRSIRLSEVIRGDLVLFRRDRRFFVHRVLDVSPDRLLTRGDSILCPDSPVGSEELLGRVVSITSGDATRAPSRLGAVGFLLASAARHSAIFCNLLLRLCPLYRRLLRIIHVSAAPRPEAAWRN